jgi:SagB-type dehydrogenase family enzyme
MDESVLRLVGLLNFDPLSERCVADGARQTVSFKDQGSLLTSWLGTFRGTKSTTLQLAAGAELTGRNREELRSLVAFLTQLAVLSPVHEVGLYLHRLGANPQSSIPRKTLAEIKAQAAEMAIRSEAGATLRVTPTRLGILANIAAQRRSCRKFAAARLTLKGVGEILRVAYSGEVCATPSAGALFPCRIHVYLRLEDYWDVYAWDPRAQTLSAYKRFNSTSGIAHPLLRHAFDSESLIHEAAAVIVISTDLAVHAAKYGNRGYRFSILEAGQIAQMIHLVAVEMGLGSLEWGAYRDGVVAEQLELRGGEEIATMIAIGFPDCESSKRPQNQREVLRSWQETAANAPQTILIRDESVPASKASLVISQVDLVDPSSCSDAVGTGTGWTTEAAYIRAVCESIERSASADVRCDFVGRESELPLGVTPRGDLAPSRLLPVFAGPDGHYTPYSAQQEYEWRFGTDAAGGVCAVPVEMVYYPLRLDTRHCARATSNGVAAGRSLAEAEDAAFRELIERDAFVRAWIGRAAPDAWSIRPGWFDDAVKEINLAPAVITAHVFPLAHLPTVGVAIRSNNRPALAFGMATKEDHELALDKAFQDALASYLSQIVHFRGGNMQEFIELPQSPREHALFYSDPIRASKVSWMFESRKEAEFYSIRTARLSQLRNRTVRFDLTPEHSPVAVARVISPDLIPIWFSPDWRHQDDDHEFPHFFS